jgi:hypothetical protein
MSSRKLPRPEELAKALGASMIIPLRGKADGPAGAASLLHQVHHRLVSRGGRPSDPEATIRRLVPLRKSVWKQIQAKAKDLSRRRGRSVSPGQLAAVLLEQGLAHFEAQS